MADLLDKYFNVRIKLRNDSYQNWNSKENFIPYDGEVIIYDRIDAVEAIKTGLDQKDFQLIKIGDGVTKLSDLPFINDFYTKEEIDEFLKEIQDQIDSLAEIARTGNVNDLIQTEGDILILDCN